MPLIKNPLQGAPTNFSDSSFNNTIADDIHAFTKVAGLPFEVTQHVVGDESQLSRGMLDRILAFFRGGLRPEHVASNVPLEIHDMAKPTVSVPISKQEIKMPLSPLSEEQQNMQK